MRELTWDSDCIDDCCGSDNGDRARRVGDRGGYCGSWQRGGPAG
jgi:hypothetical protein